MTDQTMVYIFIAAVFIGPLIFKVLLPNYYTWYGAIVGGTWRRKLLKVFRPHKYYAIEIEGLYATIDKLERENELLLRGGRKRESGGQISFMNEVPAKNGGKERIGPYNMHDGTFFMVWKHNDWKAFKAGKKLVIRKYKIENLTRHTDKYYVTTRPPGKSLQKQQVCIVEQYQWVEPEDVNKKDFVVTTLSDMPVEWEKVN